MKSPVTLKSSLAKVFLLISCVAAALVFTTPSRAANTGVLKALGQDDNGSFGLLYNDAEYTKIEVMKGLGTIKDVAAGAKFTLFLMADGSVYGVGSNYFGQLGNGTTADGITPVKAVFPAGVKITAIATGDYHSVFLSDSKEVYAAGWNGAGQLGNVQHNTEDLYTPTKIVWPSTVTTDHTVTKIAAGARHTVVLTTGGEVYTFGSNGNGQLGTTTVTDTVRLEDTSQPKKIADSVDSITAGGDNTLFVKKDGTLWGCGLNSNGQLGDGTATLRTVPVQLATGVKSVVSGFRHSVAIKTDGSAYSTGDNQFGALGSGTYTSRGDWNTKMTYKDADAKDVTLTIASLGKAFYQTLLLTSTGELWACGRNEGIGVFGVESKDDTATGAVKGSAMNKTAPLKLADNVVAAAAGYSHLVFVTSDGKAYATGGNFFGQIGNSKARTYATPIVIATNVDKFYVASNRIAYITKGEGKVYGAGNNAQLQLGNGTADNVAPDPLYSNQFVQPSTDNMPNTDVLSVALGTNHTQYLRANGIYEGGANTYGQLANGGVGGFYAKPFFFGGSPLKSALGSKHTMMLTPSGELLAAGNNSYGQLGIILPKLGTDGLPTYYDTAKTIDLYDDNSRNIAHHVAYGVVDVAAGEDYSAYITENGDLYATGYNGYGQLGDGTIISSRVIDSSTYKTTFKLPAKVTNASNVRSVSCAETYMVYVTNDNKLFGVGYNGFGPIATPNTATSLAVNTIKTPVLIDTDVISASAGNTHLVYIKSDHTLWGRGSNRAGQLGGTDYLSIVTKPRLIATNVHAAAAGNNNTVFTEDDGSTGTSVAIGASTTLSPDVVESGRVTYQWFLNGVAIPGATSKSHLIGSFSAGNAGKYVLVQYKGVTSLVVASTWVSVSGSSASSISNMSVRGTAGTNGDPLIVGLVGNSPSKNVLLRVAGPALTSFGVTGAMADPLLEVKLDATTTLASNDNWGSDGQEANLTTIFNSVGAFGFASGSKDAATVYGFSGPLSVHVNSASAGTSGVVLAEAYEIGGNTQHLKNISARNFVSDTAGSLIVGFTVSGESQKKVLIRAVGPKLAAFGVAEGKFLSDPKVSLHQTVLGTDTIIAENDDWSTQAGAAAAFTAAGAFAFDAGSKDSAVVVTLAPGSYTAIVSGTVTDPKKPETATGNALVEVYELP